MIKGAPGSSWLALSVCFALTGCGALRPPCNTLGRAVHETLYFGTATSDAPVSPEQWTQFVDQVITPRFPSGLTQWSAAGQWRSADGQIIHELTHVLDIVHGNDALSDSSVRNILSIYKSTFHQEAVLRVRSSVCSSF